MSTYCNHHLEAIEVLPDKPACVTRVCSEYEGLYNIFLSRQELEITWQQGSKSTRYYKKKNH